MANASLFDSKIEETQEFKKLSKINDELNDITEQMRSLHSKCLIKQKEFKSSVEKLDKSYSYAGKTVTLT